MNPYWLVIAFTLVTQFVIFLRWLHRRMGDAESERAFVRYLATNHLPYIYHAIQLIAKRLDIPLEELPPLRFLDLDNFSDGRGKRPSAWPHSDQREG